MLVNVDIDDMVKKYKVFLHNMCGTCFMCIFSQEMQWKCRCYERTLGHAHWRRHRHGQVIYNYLQNMCRTCFMFFFTRNAMKVSMLWKGFRSCLSTSTSKTWSSSTSIMYIYISSKYVWHLIYVYFSQEMQWKWCQCYERALGHACRRRHQRHGQVVQVYIIFLQMSVAHVFKCNFSQRTHF